MSVRRANGGLPWAGSGGKPGGAGRRTSGKRYRPQPVAPGSELLVDTHEQAQQPTAGRQLHAAAAPPARRQRLRLAPPLAYALVVSPSSAPSSALPRLCRVRYRGPSDEPTHGLAYSDTTCLTAQATPRHAAPLLSPTRSRWHKPENLAAQWQLGNTHGGHKLRQDSIYPVPMNSDAGSSSYQLFCLGRVDLGRVDRGGRTLYHCASQRAPACSARADIRPRPASTSSRCTASSNRSSNG